MLLGKEWAIRSLTGWHKKKYFQVRIAQNFPVTSHIQLLISLVLQQPDFNVKCQPAGALLVMTVALPKTLGPILQGVLLPTRVAKTTSSPAMMNRLSRHLRIWIRLSLPSKSPLRRNRSLPENIPKRGHDVISSQRRCSKSTLLSRRTQLDPKMLTRTRTSGTAGSATRITLWRPEEVVAF